MAPTMAEYKAKTKTKNAIDVANISVSFAESAKNEATRFIFLRGAIDFYIKGGEYGKAADTVERIKSSIANVPPYEIANIISSALGREDMRRAPRLQAQFQLAQTQIRAAKDAENLKTSLRRISTDPMRRQYAEALAIGGDWNAALTEFAKIAGTVGSMTKRETSGMAKSVDLGDFWWSYKPNYTGGYRVFKERAANYYRKAIAEEQVDGLKKTLIEQRLASLILLDVDNTAVEPRVPRNSVESTAGKTVSTKPPSQVGSRVPRDRKNPPGLVHRWSFTDGLADSVGKVAPAKSDNATVENGAVALRSGSPLEFPAGTVPLAPFTIQVWASATDKGLGSEDNYIFKIAYSPDGKDAAFWTWRAGTKWVQKISGFGESKPVGHGKYLIDGKPHLYTVICRSPTVREATYYV